MNKEKFFYLHIPKSAGSSMNKFLTSQFDDRESLTHIESIVDFNNEASLIKIDSYQLLSGHIVLPQMQHHLKVLDTRTTIATFRIPMEHIISHITWVRKLGDQGEENRLAQHNKTIQKIVKKLVATDLSKPKKITNFIKWLEKEEIFLFHNTQTKYLGGGHKMTPHVINNALINLNQIDHVGTVERFSEFQAMLCDKLNWKITKEVHIKENINKTNYGLDLQSHEIRTALLPLIEWDQMIYRIARNRFIDDIHSYLAKLEKKQLPRFSAVKEQLLLSQYEVKT